MAFNMGISWASTKLFKRQNRFWMEIAGVTYGVGGIGSSLSRVEVYAWEKASRPSFSFKEEEVKHTSETIYFPGRPEWKPVKVTLMDTVNVINPVAEWIGFCYGMTTNSRGFTAGAYHGGLQFQSGTSPADKFKRKVDIYALNGEGIVMDRWTYYNAWPQGVEFGDYDMTTSDIMRISLDLRYDRAEWTGFCGTA